ncbi:MAG: formate dehydrogenase subunit delta [Gammaproteobacteria bacterium]|nr:formate dehydrogenase subunit delta [Gammaproteobacteria bacterium]
MDVNKLITMANQIGDFFAANPDEEAAKKDIANHLNKFWNSVMIKGLVTHVQQSDVSDLHPRVVEAVKQHII